MWLKYHLSAFFYLWLPFVIGLFISWTLNMHFFHGDLEEEVYMEQPPGFVAQWEFSSLVCRLCKSLYGLKQFLQACFGKFSTILQQFGMNHSGADHSVFYRHSTQSRCIYSLFTLMILLSPVMIKMVSRIWSNISLSISRLKTLADWSIFKVLRFCLV